MADWVIRGGNEGESHGERDLKAGCVAIGWGRMGDLTPLTTKDAVFSRMRQVWPLWSTQQVANMGGQVWRFKDSIQVGDLVFRRLKRSRKATTMASPGWTRDMSSCQAGRFGGLRPRPSLQLGTAPHP